VSSESLELTVNGVVRRLEVPANLLLVELIRDVLGLTGTHIGCLTGDCGACTVRLNGRIVKSCLMLAASAGGGELTTIEGFAGGDRLHPIQQVFWNRHGFQCGFCLPGLLFSADDVLREHGEPDEPTIRRALDGNLCRCTGYQKVVEAVAEAAELIREAQL
jgi:carbon-monoxide dehydrogenase small subunit